LSEKTVAFAMKIDIAAYKIILMKILLHILGKIANDSITKNVSVHDINVMINSNSLERCMIFSGVGRNNKSL